jgi:hypothetical protein
MGNNIKQYVASLNCKRLLLEDAADKHGNSKRKPRQASGEHGIRHGTEIMDQRNESIQK